MTRRGKLLREAREAANVSLEMLSRWASVDMEELLAAEEGTGPRPAILVNVLEPGRYPWRGRITLAHELGHLLFDLGDPKRQVLVSARPVRTPD